RRAKRVAGAQLVGGGELSEFTSESEEGLCPPKNYETSPSRAKPEAREEPDRATRSDEAASTADEQSESPERSWWVEVSFRNLLPKARRASALLKTTSRPPAHRCSRRS